MLKFYIAYTVQDIVQYIYFYKDPNFAFYFSRFVWHPMFLLGKLQ